MFLILLKAVKEDVERPIIEESVPCVGQVYQLAADAAHTPEFQKISELRVCKLRISVCAHAHAHVCVRE